MNERIVKWMMTEGPTIKKKKVKIKNIKFLFMFWKFQVQFQCSMINLYSSSQIHSKKQFSPMTLIEILNYNILEKCGENRFGLFMRKIISSNNYFMFKIGGFINLTYFYLIQSI